MTPSPCALVPITAGHHAPAHKAKAKLEARLEERQECRTSCQLAAPAAGRSCWLAPSGTLAQAVANLPARAAICCSPSDRSRPVPAFGAANQPERLGPGDSARLRLPQAAVGPWAAHGPSALLEPVSALKGRR